MTRGEMTDRRILIINADDLGYTRGVNDAIQQCSVTGILRSSTLMANAAAFDHAVAMARDNANLDVGVHLVLTKLPPVAPPSKLTGLVDEYGCLPRTPWELMVAILEGRISREAIREELSSQIGKVLDHGLKPTHLDSHKHVHVMPQVLEIVIELAKKLAIPWVRNPFDETPFFRLLRLLDAPATSSFCIQHLKAQLLAAWRTSFFKRIRKAGIRTPHHFFGVSLTGIWNKPAAIQLLEDLPPGISEWMLHPGNCDQELRSSSTRLMEQRERERDLLLAPELQEYLARQDITLSSFRSATHGGKLQGSRN